LLIASAFHASAEPAKKVFVLGVDGLDPNLLQAYVDRDLLPNLKGLIERGEFKPLQTSMPPLSPVAWSTFISGMDPGGHGVFDFIHRDPATLMPTRAESGTNDPKMLPLGGCTVMPQPFSGGPENLRHGRAFWQILEDHGIPTTVFRIPANFPPVDSDGKSFSGMGTPDILGTPGTFSFYTDRHVPDSNSFSGGKVYPVQVVDNRVEARLVGPADPFRDQSRRECRRKLGVDFKVYLDPDRPVAKLEVQDEELVLQQGEWSEWIPVEFKALPVFASVSSIGRFYLKQVRPDFELYVTPLQIDPANPGAMQLSTPESWSHELCRSCPRTPRPSSTASSPAASSGTRPSSFLPSAVAPSSTSSASGRKVCCSSTSRVSIRTATCSTATWTPSIRTTGRTRCSPPVSRTSTGRWTRSWVGRSRSSTRTPRS
jgi:hypothetical protein